MGATRDEPNNWSDLGDEGGWGDVGGGGPGRRASQICDEGGRGVGGVGQGGGQGGEMGGAPSLKTNNWSDLAGDEGGGGGEAWWGWAREAGKGGRWGGGTREQMAGDEGVGQGGGRLGGHQRAVWEQQGVHWFFWAPLKT